MVGGRKLAGILSEVAPGASSTAEVAVALGLGCQPAVGRISRTVRRRQPAHARRAHPPAAETLLIAWIDALSDRTARLSSAAGSPAIVDDWRHCAVGIARAGDASTRPGGSFEGIAVDVGDDGALLVESAGEVRRVLAGDVHLGSVATR